MTAGSLTHPSVLWYGCSKKSLSVAQTKVTFLSDKRVAPHSRHREDATSIDFNDGYFRNVGVRDRFSGETGYSPRLEFPPDRKLAVDVQTELHLDPVQWEGLWVRGRRLEMEIVLNYERSPGQLATYSFLGRIDPVTKEFALVWLRHFSED